MPINEYKIAVVNSSTFGLEFPDLISKLNKYGKVDRFNFSPEIKGKELAEKLAGYDFIIASVTPNFSEAFFDNNEDLKLIARHGIGYNNIDIDSASENDVIVTRVSGKSERNAVAELSISLILSCIRKIISANDAVKTSKWDNRNNFIGKELSGSNIGIIGYGHIGSRAAKILKSGFDSNVLVYDPFVKDFKIQQDGFKPVSFEQLLIDSDIISLYSTLNKDNYKLIGKNEIKKMKDKVIIVNTARGELIDEKSLAKGVKFGKIGAVGLDVLTREPPVVDNPLIGLENVIITPHIGAYTDKSLRKMDKKMVEDIINYINEDKIDEVVNSKVL